MTDHAPGRPLVTFALFAYNQEQYIREAVEGAFLQTYEPLEIILSDDCSSDRTFEIMQEMAATYEGPHEVRVRRNEMNLGLCRHFILVFEASHGAYVAVAAGDDVSLPERTSTMIKDLLTTNRVFGESNFNTMDETSTIIGRNLRNDYSKNYLWKLVNADSDYFASGASAVYRRDFVISAFYSIRDIVAKGDLYNEDAVMAAYAVSVNEKPYQHKNSALVNYRVNPNSLSNFKVEVRTLSDELSLVTRERFRARTRLAFLNAVLKISQNSESFSRRLDRDALDADMHTSNIQLAASSPKFIDRVLSFQLVRNLSELRIVIARVFGLNFLSILRFSVRKLKHCKRTFLSECSKIWFVR